MDLKPLLGRKDILIPILLTSNHYKMRNFISGAEAIVMGAIDARCNFFSGYPITPATPILLQMSRDLPKVGGIAIQAEDEIAAIGFCIGAALAGSRVMTATSGPGISLFSENIGMAIMVEVPMVIVDCQRMGPATGGATTTGQGDIQFLRWGTSGGYPVIVLSPVSVSDCYNLTRCAFNLAERYRIPVFLATDKETVLTRVAVDINEFEDIEIIERAKPSPASAYKPFAYEHISDVPPLAAFGDPHTFRVTSSSHDESGYLIKDPVNMVRKNQHLEAKIVESKNEISLVNMDIQEGAETLIISYGVVARSVFETVYEARREGIKVSALTIYTLWPVPEREIKSALSGVKRIIVPELNLGQYKREIDRLVLDEQEVVGLNRVDGSLISPAEIFDSLVSNAVH